MLLGECPFDWGDKTGAFMFWRLGYVLGLLYCVWHRMHWICAGHNDTSRLWRYSGVKRIWILSNIHGKSWNMQSGEGTLLTRDSWSSLLRKSGPNYLFTGAEVLLRATEITCFQWLPLKVAHQNIRLRVLSFLSMPFSFVVLFSIKV